MIGPDSEGPVFLTGPPPPPQPNLADLGFIKKTRTLPVSKYCSVDHILIGFGVGVGVGPRLGSDFEAK